MKLDRETKLLYAYSILTLIFFGILVLASEILKNNVLGALGMGIEIGYVLFYISNMLFQCNI